MTNYIKKLLALAVTVGAMTALADAPTAAGTWTDFSSLTGDEGGTIVSGDYTLTVPAGCTVASDGALVIGSGGAPSINYTDSTTRTVSVEVEISDCNDTTEVVPINVALGTADGACVAALNGVLSQRWYSTWGEYNHGDWDSSERQIVTFTYSGVNGSDAARGSQTYINGESAINQHTGMISTRTAISGIRIGCKTGTEKLATGMKIYAIRIYTSRLSNAEVAAAYEAHKPVPPKDSSTPVFLLNIFDTSHSEVTGWLNHTQTKDSTDSPKIPKNGDYLGTADGIHFSTSSGGNFFNNHITANTDFETGTYVDIFGGEHETLAEEVATSLGLPEGTVFDADIYKSGIMNGGVNNHAATIANLDTEKTYVVYIGTGLLKSDNTASNSGITVTEASYGSIGSIDYAMTVAGSGGTVAPNYQTAAAGTALKPGKNGLLVVRLTDVTPKDDGTITFTLSGDRAGLNFLAVSEMTRNTPTKLVTALSGEKSWSELEWAADGKAYKWIDGDAAEIEVTAAATLTLDPSVDVKSIKFSGTGSYPLTLTTADGVKPDADFLAKIKLTEYTGRITYGWNASATVIAINFNATAASNTGAGASDSHKLGNDENANILGLNIFGSTWAQFTDATQATAQTVDAIDTATEGSVGSASVTWRSNNNFMYRDSTDKVIRGYLDDGSPYAQVTITDIPFTTYDAIIICATDTDGRKFNPVTVNGTNYRWNADAQKTEMTTQTGAEGTWGMSRGATVEYGRNAIKIESMTASTLSIVGGANGNGARGGIAAVVLVKSETTIPEITGDLTMSELAEKAAGDEALVLVTANATITQDNTQLDCTSLVLRAETTKTLTVALTAAQQAEVAALADGAEYDVVTAVFGLVPTFINVELKLTNLPEGFAALEVAGAYKIVKKASASIFTPANDSDWAGVTLPFYAKEFVATTNKSFAADTAYLQRYDGIESTVAVVTAAPAASRIYGLVALTGDDHGLGAITRDVYLKVSGGTPGVISGGEDATWSGDKTNPTGNILVNITGNTVVDYVYGAGLGGGTGGMLAKIDGNVGIVVDGDAQILGTLAAGWQSRHAATPEVTGNTSVLIKNVQTHATDATLDGNPNCVQGWILGGGIFKVNGGCCKIGGNSSVTVNLANSATGEFMKMIAGGGHNEGAGDGENTLGNSSVTINAPDTVMFSKTIIGGGHSTGTNKAKTGGNSSVTLNGGTYTGTIYAAGDNGEHTLVTGTATINVTAGDFTAATFVAGTATGAKTLNISGGAFAFKAGLATGFDSINFSGDFTYSFPDGWGAFTPIALGSTALSVDGQTTGQVSLSCDVQVGELLIKNATVIFDCDACTVSYAVAQEGTLRRRPDFEGMTDADRRWTATGSWLDADNNPVDWPMQGAKIVQINADQVASIIVDAKINADMINLTNTGAQEDEPSFKFLTLEPLDQVALPKENPDYVISGKLTATGFGGDLYLQSRITMAVALGADTHVFFVAWEADKETTAYPYEFTNMANPICKVGPGAFIVPSSMYTYAFNVKGGSLIYDIAASAEDVIVSGDLKKDTSADPEAHLLIKRGAGTMLYTRKELANFLDGVEVREGTFKLTNVSGDYSFWNTTTPVSVTVKDGATLDLNGKGGFAANVTLGEGSTFKNATGGVSTGSASLRAIALTGNATIEAAARFGLLANGYGATKLNLGGHTLTKIGSEPFHLCNVSGDDAGTINVQAGTFHTVHDHPVALPNAEVVLGAGTTFDVGAPTTIGELTLGPTYAFAGSSTLTINKAVNYVGAADSVFTWYTANLAEGATFAFPSTAFTMKFPTIPTTPVTLPSVAKVELSVPNLSVGYVYPIAGVAKENVIVKVNGEVSSAANVEVDATSIKILPPLSRPNPVTGEYIGFNNVFRGTTDADWATIDNWYTGYEDNWSAYAGSIAPMLPNSNAWDPVLIDGNLITEAERKSVSLTSVKMEGWQIKLGLYNGANVTVTELDKIQCNSGDNMFIAVDGTSKLTVKSPTNSKANVLNLYVAAEAGITWTSAFSSANTLNYFLKGEGSVAYAAGVGAGTHTIKRFDLTIGDENGEGMQKGIVSKKLVSFGAASAADFTIANDAVVGIFDKTLNPSVVATKSTVDALSGNEALGTYYTVQTDDGVYVKYIGYSTNPEQPTQTIIDQTTALSAFFTAHPGVTGEILVVGKATCEEAFDVTFDRTIPEGVTFSVSGHVNFKVGGSVTELPVAPIVADEGSCIGIAAPFDADYTIAANRTVRIVENMTLTHYLRPASGSGVVEIAPNVTLTESANSQINNNGIFRIYGTLNVAGLTQEWNSFNNECKVYLFAGATITGTDAGRVKTTGGYSTTFFVKDFDGASEKVVTFDIGTNHGAYDVAINYEIDPGVGFKFLRNTENSNLTATGTNIPYLEVAGNANMKVANNSGCLTGTVKASGTASIVLQGNNAFAATANLILPMTVNVGSTTQSFNATMTVESGSAEVPAFITDDSIIKKMGAGELVMGDKRPVMNVVEGSVKITASFEEITAGVLVLNVTPDAAPGEDTKVTIVDGSGSEIGIKGAPVVDPVAHTVTITLATATIEESKTMSEIKELYPDGGAIAIIGSDECDDSVKITLDEAVPSNYSFTVSGHVTFAVAGSVTAIPMSKIALNDGACVILNAPIDLAALTIAENTTVKTRADQTITLTNNGTFVVKSGATATVTASGAQAIKGVVTIEKDATFVNQLNDAVSYGTPGTTVNVYGTLAMGTTRWTVGGQSAINLYGSADVTGAGDGEAVFDVYRSGNTISVFNIEGEDPAEATIEGLVRSRNNDGNIWIQEGAKLALTAGITGVGSDAASPKISRKGNGFFTGTLPLFGKLELDYGTQVTDVSAHFRVKSGEVTLHMTGKNGTAEVICADDSEADPFIEIASGATLNLNANNLSGSLGATAATGWIVNKGTLVFQDGNGYRYFRQHLVLNGGTAKLNSGDQPVIVYGGIGDGSNAQFIARGDTESTIIVGVAGSGNGKLVLNHAEGATPGVGFFVEDGSKLTISAPIEGSDPLAKWGTGTLNIGTSRPLIAVLNGVIEVTPTDAESVANEIRLPTTLAVSSKANFHAVNETGSELTIEAVVIEATEEGGEELVIRLRGVVYTKNTLVSELPADSVGTIVMSNSSDEPIILYVDQEFPERMSELDVRGNVEIRVTEERESYGSVKLFVSEGAKAIVSGVKYPFTLIEGTGELYFDPGEGNTMLVATDNSAFTGPCTIASGSVKMGNFNQCLGQNVNTRRIYVEKGATLDINGQCGGGSPAYHVVLNGGTLANTVPGSGINDSRVNKTFPVTELELADDSFISTPVNFGLVAQGHAGTTMALNGHTLTKLGEGFFDVCNTVCTGAGGNIIIAEGTWAVNANGMTVNDGTITVKSTGALMVTDGKSATIANLVAEGPVSNTGTLTITSSVSGNNTIQGNLVLGSAAVLKLRADGGLTVVGSITSQRDGAAIQLSSDGINTTKNTRLSVLRVTEDANLPAESKIVKPTNCSRWNLSLERDGFGYRLVKPYFILIIK